MKAIKSLRATIFVPQINYSIENQKTIISLLNDGLDYIPVLSDMQQIQINSDNLLFPQNNNQWQLKSVSGLNQRILFGSQKIDIIREYNDVSENGVDLDDFCSFCSNVFAKIVETYKLNSSRLAFAPSYLIHIFDNSVVEKIASLFFLKSDFKNSHIDNCDFSNVFRVKEIVNEKQIIINHFFKVEQINRIDISKQPLASNPYISIDIDINTKAEEGYIFNKEDILDFYRKVLGWTSDFLDYFFNEV